MRAPSPRSTLRDVDVGALVAEGKHCFAASRRPTISAYLNVIRGRFRRACGSDSRATLLVPISAAEQILRPRDAVPPTPSIQPSRNCSPKCRIDDAGRPLLPGMYAEVDLAVHARASHEVIPADTLMVPRRMFRRWQSFNPDGVRTFQLVHLGRDMGTTMKS